MNIIVLRMIITLVINALIFGGIVFLIVKGIINKKTRKTTLIITGTILALGLFIVGTFVYQFKRNTSWIERSYDDTSRNHFANRYQSDSLADLLDTYYSKSNFGDTETWYQTEWYPSLEELAVQMPFESNEERNLWVESLPDRIITQETQLEEFSSIPAFKNRDVEYYGVDVSIFNEEMRDDFTRIRVVIDQDTGEALLGVYDYLA